jgi:hypothetical protein
LPRNGAKSAKGRVTADERRWTQTLKREDPELFASETGEPHGRTSIAILFLKPLAEERFVGRVSDIAVIPNSNGSVLDIDN